MRIRIILMKDIIIFDYDGVIIDSLDLVFSIYNDLAPKYNCQKLKNKQEFTKFFKGNFFDGWGDNGISHEDSEKFLQEMADKLAENTDKVSVFPGIKEALEKLAGKYRLMIITSNLSRVIEKALDKKNIKVIEEVIGADKERSKVKKIEKVKEKNPGSKIYYIGDTTGDIYEGRKAGVTTIGVSWGFHGEKTMNSAHPDYLVNTPDELLDIFN